MTIANLCKLVHTLNLTLVRRSLSTTSDSPKPSYFHHIGKHPLVYRNVGQSLDIAVERFPNTEAIVSCHEDKRLTFTELRDEVNRLSAGFLKLGLKSGDAVGIWAPNNLHWYLTMLATARAGLTLVGINPAFQGPEIEYCLKKVGVKAIVAADRFKSQNYYDILKSVLPELADSDPGRIRSERLPQLQSVIIDSADDRQGAFRFEEIFKMADAEGVRHIEKLQSHIQPDSPCNIQFTSGTTGHPKAAILSHYNFVNNGIHVGNRNQLLNERICVQVPLFHAFGVVITIMAALSSGATLVLPTDGYSPEASLRAIFKEKCTVIHGTPTMYVDLIRKQKELQLPLTTAKLAITGGAPCSPQLFKDIKDVLGLQKVKTVFGMTETTAVIFQSQHDDSDEQVQNTVGHLQDHIEAKVIDANGETVPFGQSGELCIRGYTTMLGYFGDELKTKEMVTADKWLRTGDQFVLQEDGYGKIVGRLKEMIIRGGENLFPKEIEDFLNTHPKILETHVIGIPDERLGEEVCAFIRLHDNADSLSEADIKAFCKGKIAHFKIPKYIRIVESFPKTTSGKIQKFKLQHLMAKNNSKA